MECLLSNAREHAVNDSVTPLLTKISQGQGVDYQSDPPTEVEVLLSKAQEAGLERTGLSVHCRDLGLRPVELLNALPIEVTRLVLGEMPYESAMT